MNFEEHLVNHRNPDGTYDLDAAEEDRRYEIEASPEGIVFIDHTRAFDAEITHWNQTLKLLDPNETIADAMARGAA